jgi:hypothetical protein
MIRQRGISLLEKWTTPKNNVITFFVWCLQRTFLAKECTKKITLPSPQGDPWVRRFRNSEERWVGAQSQWVQVTGPADCSSSIPCRWPSAGIAW